MVVEGLARLRAGKLDVVRGVDGLDVGEVEGCETVCDVATSFLLGLGDSRKFAFGAGVVVAEAPDELGVVVCAHFVLYSKGLLCLD